MKLNHSDPSTSLSFMDDFEEEEELFGQIHLLNKEIETSLENKVEEEKNRMACKFSRPRG